MTSVDPIIATLDRMIFLSWLMLGGLILAAIGCACAGAMLVAWAWRNRGWLWLGKR